MSHRTLGRFAALSVTVLAVLAGCGPSKPAPLPPPSPAPAFAALDAAVNAINAARPVPLGSVQAIGRAAAAIDATDAAASRGDRHDARTLEPRSASAALTARARLTALGSQIAAYRAALAQLAAAGASPQLSVGLRRALGDVVAAGQAEASALSDYQRVAARIWPVYQQLNLDEQTWFTHSIDGWFANPVLAGQVYVVSVDPIRALLQPARDALAAADSARVEADARMSAALSVAAQLMSGAAATPSPSPSSLAW